MKLLCVTHSSRPFLDVRSTVNFLEKRFPADRLENLPPLTSIPGIDVAVPLTGSLTLWKIEEDDNFRLSFLRSYDPGYKVHQIAEDRASLESEPSDVVRTLLIFRWSGLGLQISDLHLTLNSVPI